MPNRFQYPFQPINSSEPSFTAAFDNTAANHVLESTGTREWQGPGSRAVSIAAMAADDYYINFGSSLVTCTSSGNKLILGGTDQVFRVRPAQTYVAFVSSTDISMNLTLGYGQ